jgi:hypothetical protein
MIIAEGIGKCLQEKIADGEDGETEIGSESDQCQCTGRRSDLENYYKNVKGSIYSNVL